VPIFGAPPGMVLTFPPPRRYSYNASAAGTSVAVAPSVVLTSVVGPSCRTSGSTPLQELRDLLPAGLPDADAAVADIRQRVVHPGLAAAGQIIRLAGKLVQAPLQLTTHVGAQPAHRGVCRMPFDRNEFVVFGDRGPLGGDQVRERLRLGQLGQLEQPLP
jgi:hypothetical protein